MKSLLMHAWLFCLCRIQTVRNSPTIPYAVSSSASSRSSSRAALGVPSRWFGNPPTSLMLLLGPPIPAVALLFGRRIAPADVGTAVWNENSGSLNSQLCGNKCETLVARPAEFGHFWHFPRPPPRVGVIATCELDILKLTAASSRHSRSYRQFLNLTAMTKPLILLSLASHSKRQHDNGRVPSSHTP